MFALTSPTLLAAASVFSWFGLMYFGTPVLVLLTAAIRLSTRECRALYLVVSGAIFAIAAFGVFMEHSLRWDARVSDDELAVWANVVVCTGSVVGIVCCRIAHGLLQRVRIR